MQYNNEAQRRVQRTRKGLLKFCGAEVCIVMSRRLSFVLILTGLLMFGLGLMRGEALLVMQKAVRICLECIGLG